MQIVIRVQHGCLSRHVATIPLTHQANGKIVWQGEVEIFDLQNHPIAKRCYAFAYRDSFNKKHLTAVLEHSTVDSPRSAVRAGLLAHDGAKATNVSASPNAELNRAERHVAGKFAPVARLSVKDIVAELQNHTAD